MSGSTGERVAVVTARARSLPPLTYSIDEDMVAKLHLSAEQIHPNAANDLPIDP
jgi:hypothetical protein